MTNRDWDIIEAMALLLEADAEALKMATITKGWDPANFDYPVIMVGVEYGLTFVPNQLGALDRVLSPFVLWIEQKEYSDALKDVGEIRDRVITLLHESNLSGTCTQCVVSTDTALPTTPVETDSITLYRAEVMFHITREGDL